MDNENNVGEFNLLSIGESIENRSRDVRANLEEHLGNLKALQEQILLNLPLIEGEIVKTTRALTALSDEQIVGMPENSEESGLNAAGYGENPKEVVCGNARVRDLENCPSQRRAMYIIAGKNDGIVKLGAASELVVAAGMSTTTARAVAGTLHHYLSNNADFTWIAPSTFKLTLDDDEELTTGDELAFAERMKNAA